LEAQNGEPEIRTGVMEAFSLSLFLCIRLGCYAAVLVAPLDITISRSGWRIAYHVIIRENLTRIRQKVQDKTVFELTTVNLKILGNKSVLKPVLWIRKGFNADLDPVQLFISVRIWILS
jgi:hypothetical protein